jgi:hypothetical protein
VTKVPIHDILYAIRAQRIQHPKEAGGKKEGTRSPHCRRGTMRAEVGNVERPLTRRPTAKSAEVRQTAPSVSAGGVRVVRKRSSPSHCRLNT